MGREIEIDLCVPCQSVWFDARENLQLTPGATLAMFRIIGEHVLGPRSRIATSPSARAATRSCAAPRTCSATPASSISAARTITAG
jgi:hypothetical protein